MQSMDMELIGRKIKEERKKQGMTQSDLAEKIYTDDSIISRIERGKGIGDFSKLLLIANALKIDIRHLIDSGIVEYP